MWNCLALIHKFSSYWILILLHMVYTYIYIPLERETICGVFRDSEQIHILKMLYLVFYILNSLINLHLFDTSASQY